MAEGQGNSKDVRPYIRNENFESMRISVLRDTTKNCKKINRIKNFKNILHNNNFKKLEEN